jgi:DNA invertase Pin-like site-specific DNA recombinase
LAKVGYARVSSLEQARDSSALDQQQERLRQAGCSVLFTDVQSGTRDNRPQLKAALASLKPGDTLIATRLDRLTRSPSFNEQLLNRFSQEGAPGLLLLDDGLDLRTVAGRLTARLLAAVSAGEVERLAERTAHGRAHRQSKGGHGAKPPWGFLRSPDGLGLVVDPALEQICRELIQHFLQSRSIRATSTWLLETHRIRKGKTSLKRWLQNPAIAGGVGRCAGTYAVDPDGTRRRLPPPPGHYDSIEWGTHTGLITRAQFDEVNRAFRVSAGRGGGAHRKVVQRTWHSGRFLCSGCGARLTPHWRRLRCINSACPCRYGRGHITLTLGRASLCRAIEWMGMALALNLAPVHAAAENSQQVEPAPLLDLREQVHKLRSMAIPGTEGVIAQKDQEIQQMISHLHGSSVTTAEVLERLRPLLLAPWELTDEELSEIADDLELVAQVQDHWVVEVKSARFGCGWQFTPQTKREAFRVNIDGLSPIHRLLHLGLIDQVALNRTWQWWEVVDEASAALASF